MDYLKEFISKLHNLDKARRVNEVFKDFLILCTCSLTQPFYRSDEIEQRYLNTVKQYTKEQAEEFSKLLALLVMTLEEKHQDFLGQVYMQLNLGNIATGQFFTPYHVSKLMSEINFIEIEDNLKVQEYIRLSDACCGSAGMIIAFAETMKNKGYNYQNQLYVEAIDIDEMCFMMAYIQLSLLGVSAKVIHGDSLTLDFHKVLYTPFYFLNRFEWRLKQNSNPKPKQDSINQMQIISSTQLKLYKM